MPLPRKAIDPPGAGSRGDWRKPGRILPLLYRDIQKDVSPADNRATEAACFSFSTREKKSNGRGGGWTPTSKGARGTREGISLSPLAVLGIFLWGGRFLPNPPGFWRPGRGRAGWAGRGGGWGGGGGGLLGKWCFERRGARSSQPFLKKKKCGEGIGIGAPALVQF